MNFATKMTANLLIICLCMLISACSEEHSPEQREYIAEIEKMREEINEAMRSSPESPFNYKGEVEFHPLKYFEVDPDFKFRSKLYEYEPKDTITIYGTKGEARTTIRYGYVVFPYEGEEYRVNVYESTARNGKMYHSIWFTDKTTNKETYGVGRYLDFEKHDNPEHIYEVDFNLAFNPYCAYSPDYSCAIPTKEDYIDLSITAGEKKFHD